MAKNSGFIYYPKDVNFLDEQMKSPLFYATQHVDKDFIHFLFDLGVDVNYPCAEGNTATHLAFQSNNEELI